MSFSSYGKLDDSSIEDKRVELILKALFRRSDNLEMIQSVKRQAENQNETQ